MCRGLGKPVWCWLTSFRFTLHYTQISFPIVAFKSWQHTTLRCVILPCLNMHTRQKCLFCKSQYKVVFFFFSGCWKYLFTRKPEAHMLTNARTYVATLNLMHTSLNFLHKCQLNFSFFYFITEPVMTENVLKHELSWLVETQEDRSPAATRSDARHLH